MTGLFPIPNTWAWATLGEIAEVVGGVTKDSKKQNDPACPLVPYLRVANVQRGYLDLEKVSKIRVPEGVVEKLRLQPGDVLLNEGGDRDKLGRGWVWNGEVPNCIHQNHVFRARVIERVLDPKLLAWYVNECARHWFEANATQSVNLASISKTRIQQLPVPVPPVAEQRRIVAATERHLSRLEAAQKLAATAYRRLAHLSKALIRTRFAELSLQKDIHVRLADVATVASGSTPKGISDLLTAQSSAGAVPYYKVGDMNLVVDRYMNESRTYISRDDAASLRLHVRPAGTVLIPKRGGAIHTNKKRIMRSPGAYDLNTMGLVPSEALDSVYLWYWFKGVDLSTLADGSNVPQINKPDLVDLIVPVPPLTQQKEVVSELDAAITEMRRLSDVPILARATSLRCSILAEAFAGRLVEQDPADEPASVLLERIRAERAERGPERGPARGSVRRARRGKGEKAPQKETLL